MIQNYCYFVGFHNKKDEIMEKVFHPGNPHSKADPFQLSANYPLGFANNPDQLQQRLLKGLEDNLFPQKGISEIRFALNYTEFLQDNSATSCRKPFN